MKPLGETVRALREENHWTLQDLAARVQRAGAPNVKYQHLQQLETKPHTRPRYIIELAIAFGKSVEDLRSWQPGMPEYGNNHRDGVRELPPPNHHTQPTITADEAALLADYRAAPDNIRTALRVLAAAARSRKKAKPTENY